MKKYYLQYWDESIEGIKTIGCKTREEMDIQYHRLRKRTNRKIVTLYGTKKNKVPI